MGLGVTEMRHRDGMNRRDFLCKSGLMLAAAPLLASASRQVFAAAPAVPEWSNGMLPLYCLAYIEPLPDLSRGQMREIAKFPLAVVPQDDRPYYHDWKRDIRRRNPDIKLLAYQMVIEETDVPGPGHRALMGASGEWVHYAGMTPRSDYKDHRFFDPRSRKWQRAMVEACDATLSSYDYDGLFFDQCSVFIKLAPVPSARAEMHEALQQVLDEVRRRHPEKILIANCSDSWRGVNGEMNEGRPDELAAEAAPFAGHVGPRFELFHHYLEGYNLDKAEQMMRLAMQNRCFFGCAPNPQTIRWYDFFDRVLASMPPLAPELLMQKGD